MYSLPKSLLLSHPPDKQVFGFFNTYIHVYYRLLVSSFFLLSFLPSILSFLLSLSSFFPFFFLLENKFEALRKMKCQILSSKIISTMETEN